MTNREEFLKKHGLPSNRSLSLKEISKLSGYPVSTLQEVYNRGIGAYSNLGSVRLLDFSKNPNTTKYPASARLSKEQWAMARVYSFVNKGTTYHTTDSDLVKEGK